MSRTCSGKKARLKMVDYFCYNVLRRLEPYFVGILLLFGFRNAYSYKQLAQKTFI